MEKETDLPQQISKPAHHKVIALVRFSDGRFYNAVEQKIFYSGNDPQKAAEAF